MTQSTLSDRFIYVSRGNACPKCQATKDCRYKAGGLVHCHNHRANKGSTEDGYISRGEDREGFAMWAKNEKAHKSAFVGQMSNVRKHEQKLAKDKAFANSQKPLQAHKFWFNQSTFLEQHHADVLSARGLSAEDIINGRFKSTGNGSYQGFSIPCSDIDGLTRGAQVRYDNRDNRYGWLADHRDKHLIEHHPVLELPSQWVSAGDRNEIGIIQRNYNTIDEMWITEGTLKPYITFCKNKSKNVIVVGFSGGTTNWLSLIRGIEKLPKLKTIVILPDAGAALNDQVAKKVITLGATLNSLVGTRIDVKVADWGQWADKSKLDCDEIESVTGFDVIRRTVKEFKDCARKCVATERLAEFECGLIKSHSEKLHHVATKDRAFECIAISQDDPTWMKQVGDSINSTTNDAVLLAMNTGFGKTHSIEYLVGQLDLNVIYFSVSPDNPATEWIENNGIRFPVKHQGYLPNSNGSKLPSGRPQMVRSDDPRADTERTLVNKAAEIPTNCPMFQSRVASRMGTAETDSPCKGCPKAGSCGYLNDDMPKFIEAITAQAKAGKGMLIRCHHASAPRLSNEIAKIPELENVVFHKVLDDVHPETDTAVIRVPYIKKAIQKMIAMDKVECASIRKFAFNLNAVMVSAGLSIYTKEVNPLDIDFESYEYQLLLQLVDEELRDSKTLEYVGDDYGEYYPADCVGFFKGIPGTEFVNARGRTQYKQYDPESKKASIAYLEAEKSAMANRGDALHSALLKGEIGKLFKLLADHPAAHMRMDQKELTMTWLDQNIIDAIKSIGGGKIIKMDATIIDSAFCAAWGFSRSRVTQFVSAQQDNSNLTFVDMLDIDRLSKRSPIKIADQLTDFAVYLAKVQCADVAFISSREFLGKDNIDRMKKTGIKNMSAFGDSVGSNAALACTHLIIASSFAINIGALEAEYQVIFKALPYYMDGEYKKSTESYSYYCQMRNVAQIKQAVGRIRHNRRKGQPLRAYLCDIGNLYGDLFAAYPGCKYETINISDIAQTPKQNKRIKFINAQHYIWSQEGSSDSFIAYKDIATRHFPASNNDVVAKNLREGLGRMAEKFYRVGKYNEYRLPLLDKFKFKEKVSPVDHTEEHIRDCWGKNVPISQLLMIKLRPSMAGLHASCSEIEAGQHCTVEPQNDAQMDAAMIAVEERRIHIELANEARDEYLVAMDKKKPDEPDIESEHDRHLAAMFAPPVF